MVSLCRVRSAMLFHRAILPASARPPRHSSLAPSSRSRGCLGADMVRGRLLLRCSCAGCTRRHRGPIPQPHSASPGILQQQHPSHNTTAILVMSEQIGLNYCLGWGILGNAP